MTVDNISFSYEKTHKLISDLSFDVDKHDRIFIVGRNGAGKSTLLRLLAKLINPEAGKIKYHANTRTGFFSQSDVKSLNEDLTVVDEVLASAVSCSIQEARNICGSMMFSGSDSEKKISVLSGGEKCRVLLARLLGKPVNLLLLDEPSNHLDMESCDALVAAIKKFDGAVIMVTHNELFLRELAEKLIVFDNDTVTFYSGGYDYFLDKAGWCSENAAPENTEDASLRSKKTKKKQEADIRNERYRLLKPLEDEIENTEHVITRLEGKKQDFNSELIKASGAGAAERIAAASIAVKELEKQLLEHYEALEKLYDKHIRLMDEFEMRFKDQESAQ